MSAPTHRLSRRSRTWRPTLRTKPTPRRARHSWASWAIAAAGLVLVIAFVVVCVQSMSTGPPAEPRFEAAQTVPPGANVSLPLSTFADGRPHYYRYTTATGREARFFLVKSQDGVVRAAFDACDNCYRQRRGFRQVGDRFVCNACGRTFLPQHINVLKGGCNPAPLDRTVDGERVIIRAAALELGVSYF